VTLSSKVNSLYKDNTKDYWGSWSISNNQIVITIEGKTETGNYKFLNNSQTLEITDISGNSTVLNKK